MGATEIFAAIVGRAERSRCLMFHLSPAHDAVGLIYPFWILRGPKRVTLIDTGFSAAAAAQRGIGDYHDPTALLAEVGVDPADVEQILVSHLHFDHFCAPERFPNARFVIQHDDVAYFSGAGTAHPAGRLADPPSIAALAELRRDGRVELLDGDKALGDGVSVVRVGGHTPGSQVIVLEREGGRIVFACDASHMYGNLQTRTPSAIIYRYDDYQRGFAAIERLATGGRWFPGHDPEILTHLTPVGESVYALRGVAL
jgi:glyoxylase-like metal-dependent hydrolase (beta-lactamase superfamily II)